MHHRVCAVEICRRVGLGGDSLPPLFVGGLVALGFESTDRLPYLAATLAKFSIVYSLALVEWFVALHLLAFQYARSNVPYRLRMTWPVAAILLSGLVAGVALYVWGVSLA